MLVRKTIAAATDSAHDARDRIDNAATTMEIHQDQPMPDIPSRILATHLTRLSLSVVLCRRGRQGHHARHGPATQEKIGDIQDLLLSRPSKWISQHPESTHDSIATPRRE